MSARFEELKKELLELGYEPESISVQRGLVFFANPYEVKEDGKTNRGITMRYILKKHLDPTRVPNDTKLGVMVSTKNAIPVEKMNHFKKVPGYYDFLCLNTVDGKGTMGIIPQDVEYVGMLRTDMILDDGDAYTYSRIMIPGEITTLDQNDVPVVKQEQPAAVREPEAVVKEPDAEKKNSRPAGKDGK